MSGFFVMAGKWRKDNPGKELPDSFGLLELRGCMTRINEQWECVDFMGEIRFYNSFEKGGWIEFSAYFVHGKLNQLEKQL